MSRTLFTSRAGGDLKLAQNRESLRRNLSLASLHFMRQSHSNIVLLADVKGGEFECDALVTRSSGVGLAALAADCMPVTFSGEGVVGVAHIGRVGLVSGLAQEVVAVMRSQGAGGITATIGPSICFACYQVSGEMYKEITSQLPATATSNEERTLDLQSGVSAQLAALSIPVRDLGICTLESNRYFSYRGGDLQARQAGIISQ